MQITVFLFCLLAVVTVATAFLTVLSKNPIHSAIYLVICFFSIAGHYLLLNSQFLSIVHIIVYSGAIMILFIFSLMLMNLGKIPEINKKKIITLAAVAMFCVICYVMISVFTNAANHPIGKVSTGKDFQSINVLGKFLMNEYMVPFEFTSVLLIVAMIGAVLLSKKEKQ